MDKEYDPSLKASNSLLHKELSINELYQLYPPNDQEGLVKLFPHFYFFSKKRKFSHKKSKSFKHSFISLSFSSQAL